MTDTRNLPSNTQSLEPAQDEIQGIFKDRKEVMRLDAPRNESNLSQYGIEFNPREVLLIAQQHAFSPMFIQGIAMGTNDKPTHNARWNEIKAIDHLQLHLS